MASLTTGERLDRLKVYLNQYLPLQKLPDQFLIKLIERSRDAVWRGIILEREYLFRKTTTVADGTPYPADYVSYANNAYYDNAGSDTPFAYANIQEIGVSFNNTFGAASVSDPRIFFSDQTIHTAPASLSGITFEYIFRPTALSGAPNSTTDEMPEDTEDMIVRGAFERTLNQLRNDPATLQIAEVQKDQVESGSQQYYTDYYNNAKLAGGVELVS